MNMDEILRRAHELDAREEYAKVIPLATALVEAGEPWSISGYLLRATAYENGAGDKADGMAHAVCDYRQLTVLSRHTAAYQNVARALMKLGHDNYPAALRFLEEARQLEETPEIALGFAQYYRTSKEPDLVLARMYYLRAALHGRFDGFFGYAEVSRLLGQKSTAMAADCFRILIGPFLWLLLGRKARYQF